MSSRLKDSHIEDKFNSASNTQDNIQTLSLWVLHHRAHHHRIVSTWIKVLQKAKISHRLTLFYLANDVIQNSKRKGFTNIITSFAGVLKEATLLVRDAKISQSVERVFKIWEQRNVFDADFVADLISILTHSKVLSSTSSKLLADFKTETVIKKIKSMQKLEQDASSKSSLINMTKLNATNAEIVQQFKDRIHGQQFKRDFDESIRNLENLVEALDQEIRSRNDLVLLLEQSVIYYETQNKEAKLVANAYKNFDGRVKSLQKKLADVSSHFPSPLPSPTADAPSPTTSDRDLELQLPNDEEPDKDLENLDNVPSPIGSPEGLNLPPDNEPDSMQPPATKKPMGNPIPTLSNFFGHEENGMTSWLGAFSTSTETSKMMSLTKADKKKKNKDPSSLDSRLSNLLSNIPNLPTGLQNTLFSSAPTAISSGENKKEKFLEGSLTPLKDEYSGQNTPLQDEDTHCNNTFFSKLASGNKTHSPKDILKGLTNLIQTKSSEKEDKNKVSSSSVPSGQSNSMSSFIQNIIPSVTSHLSTASTYFSSSQSQSDTTLPTSVSSYETTTFTNMPSYSTTTNERHLSHIPSLVPSMPFENYGYPTQNYSSQEYNPEMEIFEADMEIESLNDAEIPSPDIEPLTPPPSETVSDELPRSNVPARRLSTLITVVTDGPSIQNKIEKTPPSDEQHKSDKENVSEDRSTADVGQPWKDPTSTNVVPTDVLPPPENSRKISSPNEEFFIGKSEPLVNMYFSAPSVAMDAPPNGGGVKYSGSRSDYPMSRIETLQSPRGDLNGRFLDNWTDNDRIPVEPHRLPDYGPTHRETFYNDRFQRPQNFRSRENNWTPRHRFDAPFHQKRDFPYQSFGPQNQRYPQRFRGQGSWGRNQSHY